MQTARETDQQAALQFWLTFDQAAVGMALVRPDGRFLRVNPELRDLLGYTEDELTRTTFQSLTHTDDLETEQALVSKAIKGEVSTYKLEKRYRRRDSGIVWVAQSATLIRDERGKPDRFILVTQDITGRRVAQEELAQARERYQAVCDDIDEFVSVHDLDGTYLFVSQASGQLLGYLPKELAGTNIFNSLHLEDRKPLRDTYKKLAASGGTRHVTCRMRNKTGKFVPVELHLRAISGAKGDVEVLSISRPVEGLEQAFTMLVEEKESAEERSRILGSLALRDTLTGLVNRHGVEQLLTHSLSSKRASTYPFGCLLLDVDGFKAVNNVYGLAIGDIVLKRIAKVLADCCRADDYVGRYGGDEFVVVLPHTNAAGTVVVGERIRKAIETSEWLDLPSEHKITLSVGGTCVTHAAPITVERLLSVVDSQLYQAKQMGRNQLVMDARRTSGWLYGQ